MCANTPGGDKDACQGDSGGPLVSSGGGDGVTPGQNYELMVCPGVSGVQGSDILGSTLGSPSSCSGFKMLRLQVGTSLLRLSVQLGKALLVYGRT